MKLAFSTLGCPGWSWDEIYATAKDLGLDGIEIRGVGKEMQAPNIKVFSPENRAATLEKLKQGGLELPILTTGASLGYTEDYEGYMAEAKAHIDFAPLVGAKNIRVMISPTGAPGGFDVEQTSRLYSELCDYAKGKGVKVLIETNAELADSSVMKRFMEGRDPEVAGVLWDIHHPFRYYHESPAQTYGNIGPWVAHVHVKDSVFENDKVTYRMMGYGDIPVYDALKILKDADYQGFVSLEWLKRWTPELQEPGIVFSHYVSYMRYLLEQL